MVKNMAKGLKVTESVTEYRENVTSVKKATAPGVAVLSPNKTKSGITGRAKKVDDLTQKGYSESII